MFQTTNQVCICIYIYICLYSLYIYILSLYHWLSCSCHKRTMTWCWCSSHHQPDSPSGNLTVKIAPFLANQPIQTGGCSSHQQPDMYVHPSISHVWFIDSMIIYLVIKHHIIESSNITFRLSDLPRLLRGAQDTSGGGFVHMAPLGSRGTQLDPAGVQRLKEQLECGWNQCLGKQAMTGNGHLITAHMLMFHVYTTHWWRGGDDLMTWRW